MRFSSKFFLYGPFFLFVALAASVMIYWWVAATALSKRLDALDGHSVAPGVHMHFASKRIAGFPFRLDVIFKDFTLSAESTRGPIVWHTDNFASHVLTYASNVTIFEAAGPQDISWTDENGERREFRFTPGMLRASAVTKANGLVQFDLDSLGDQSPRFAAVRAQLHLRRDPALDALDLVADLQSVRFAGDAAKGFANGLSHVRIEGRLSPMAPFASLLAGSNEWRNALERWRSVSGVFKVDQAAAFWGKCEATSSGLVTLDEGHRLSGSLDLSLADCDALAKDAASIAPNPRDHRAILAVLSDLATREPAGKDGALPATIVFKNGIVYVGPGRALAHDNYFEPVGLLHALY